MSPVIQGLETNLETWIFQSNAKTKMNFLSGTPCPVSCVVPMV